jgi:hypothetical protein
LGATPRSIFRIRSDVVVEPPSAKIVNMIISDVQLTTCTEQHVAGAKCNATESRAE